MNGKVRAALAALALLCLASSAFAQSELQNYVAECQRQLGFNASDIAAMNCNDGPLFFNGGPTAINDYLVHKRVNDSVDALVACRWGDDRSTPPKNTKFASMEMLLHNRINQQTCFFAAKDRPAVTGDTTKPVTSAIVSPTNFGAHPNADDFWLQPTQLNNKTLLSDHNNGMDPTTQPPDSMRCVGCHSQGAILATDMIVKYLAQYGVINNRHQTLVDMTAQTHYHAVGASGYQGKPVITAFKDWDSIIAGNITSGFTCASGCHSIAGNSKIGNLFIPSNTGTRLLPSISYDLGYMGICCMAPAEDSDWRWINLDTPADGVENEAFVDAKDPNLPPPIPSLVDGCDDPADLEAHAVGVPVEASTSASQLAKLPDHLRYFNVREGLLCLNSDQEPGTSCHDYSTSYLCNGIWTDESSGSYYNHGLAGDGDHEERSRNTGLCANPTAIRAHVTTTPDVIYGPNDRLARLSRYGLTCNNIDQANGATCSNYVVRYRFCGTGMLSYQGKIKSGSDGMLVTASSGADNAPAKGQPQTPAWNTQTWVLEPIKNTDYFRLRNTGTNTYLNVSTKSEAAAVVTSLLRPDWDSEKWTLDKTGTGGTRLRNVGSGKYLTLADQSTFSNLLSQGLNTGWSTQLWAIQ